jgi:hypothetical protein
MAKKLVFSGYKFLESCLKEGYSDRTIDKSFSLWATDCEGMTVKEMHNMGLGTEPDWMEEVDDET